MSEICVRIHSLFACFPRTSGSNLPVIAHVKEVNMTEYGEKRAALQGFRGFEHMSRQNAGMANITWSNLIIRRDKRLLAQYRNINNIVDEKKDTWWSCWLVSERASSKLSRSSANKHFWSIESNLLLMLEAADIQKYNIQKQWPTLH